MNGVNEGIYRMNQYIIDVINIKFLRINTVHWMTPKYDFMHLIFILSSMIEAHFVSHWM